MGKKRIEYIDLFRTAGIMLMIIGHINFGTKVDHLMHAFHMPMFFFVSGYFYSPQKEFNVFLKNKVKTLLIPYAGFGMLFVMIATGYEAVVQRKINYTYFSHMVWDNTTGTALTGVLWFLTALFLCEVIYHLIRKNVKNQSAVHLIVVVLYVFGMYATRLLPFRLPWAMDAALVGMGFFHVAHVIRCKSNYRIVKTLFSLNPIVSLAAGGGYKLPDFSHSIH